MKILFSFFFLFSILNFQSSLVFAQKKFQNDDRLCLELVGKTSFKNKPVPDVLVNVYEKNELIRVLKTDPQGAFKITLEKGKEYSLEIQKEGYEKRLLSVNTHLPALKENQVYVLFEFSFELEMMEKIEAAEKYYYDFPVAVIRYNPKERVFDFSEAYTSFIKKETSPGKNKKNEPGK